MKAAQRCALQRTSDAYATALIRQPRSVDDATAIDPFTQLMPREWRERQQNACECFFSLAAVAAASAMTTTRAAPGGSAIEREGGACAAGDDPTSASANP